MPSAEASTTPQLRKDRLTKQELIPRKYRIVNRRELAAFLMLDEATVRAFFDYGLIQYAKNMDGDPIKGKFDLWDASQAIIMKERKAQAARKTGNQQVQRELEIAKLQGVKATVEQKLIQNTIIFGNLYRKEDVIKEWDDMVLAIRSHFLDFPWHLAGKVLGHEDRNTVIKIIQEETERCFSDLAAMNEDKLRKIQDRDRKNSKVRANLESGDASDIDNEFDSSISVNDVKTARAVGRPRKT